MKKLAIFLFILMMGTVALSDDKYYRMQEKFNRCERYCNRKHQICVDHSIKLMGKRGSKAKQICWSHFTSCMGRCDRYRPR